MDEVKPEEVKPEGEAVVEVPVEPVELQAEQTV